MSVKRRGLGGGGVLRAVVADPQPLEKEGEEKGREAKEGSHSEERAPLQAIGGQADLMFINISWSVVFYRYRLLR